MKKVIGVLLGILGIGIAAVGLDAVVSRHRALTAIGGPDGPAVLFWAGTVGDALAWVGIVAGIGILAVAVFMTVRKK